jgi:hypothetical protein
MAIHPFSQTGFAFFGDQARLIILGDEVVQIMIGFEDDISAASAIAAAGAALGPIFFALERNATFAAMPGSGVNFYLVNEHVKGNKKARPTASPQKV